MSAKLSGRPGSGLLGPFPLNAETIAKLVEPLSIGAFAAGPLRPAKNPSASAPRFFVRRVGRDDRDLAVALMALIGRYDAFKFRTYVSTRRAYEKECRLFHDFSPPDSRSHPVRPPNTRFACPVDGCADGMGGDARK